MQSACQATPQNIRTGRARFLQCISSSEVRAVEVVATDLRYRNPFPYLSSDQATALLKRSRGADARSDPAPELVFLPMDCGLPEQPGPAAGWHGGGVSPGDPVWLLAGSDGRDYINGADRRVYTLGDLPMS